MKSSWQRLQDDSFIVLQLKRQMGGGILLHLTQFLVRRRFLPSVDFCLSPCTVTLSLKNNANPLLTSCVPFRRCYLIRVLSFQI